MEKGLIWFKRTLSSRVLVESTKTRKSRAAPLYSAARAILEKLPRGIGRTYVFRNSRARNPLGRYTIDVLDNNWQLALKRARLKPIPLKNGTRHSLGMQLRNQEGWTIENIALRLGHREQRTTAVFYARGEVELLRALVEGPAVAKRLPTKK